MEKTRMSFTGHETFYCRHLWLKKGYDFLVEKKNFNSEEAIVDLGVGKNMITAIKFWMKAFGLTEYKNNNYEITQIASRLLDDKGWDAFLEYNGSIWLLHYYLVKNNIASIYNLVFNEFRKEKPEFDKIQLKGFLQRKCEEQEIPLADKTLENDIRVFLNSYQNNTKAKNDLEDNYSNFLSELKLIEKISHPSLKGESLFIIQNKERRELPLDIFFYVILDKYEGKESISFKNLYEDINSIGTVFVMTKDGISKKIKQLIEKYPFVVDKDDAGVRELQIKNRIDKWEVLNNYYAN